LRNGTAIATSGSVRVFLILTDRPGNSLHSGLRIDLPMDPQGIEKPETLKSRPKPERETADRSAD
jgi:hypothetical protein